MPHSAAVAGPVTASRDGTVTGTSTSPSGPGAGPSSRCHGCHRPARASRQHQPQRVRRRQSSARHKSDVACRATAFVNRRQSREIKQRKALARVPGRATGPRSERRIGRIGRAPVHGPRSLLLVFRVTRQSHANQRLVQAVLSRQQHPLAIGCQRAARQGIGVNPSKSCRADGRARHGSLGGTLEHAPVDVLRRLCPLDSAVARGGHARHKLCQRWQTNSRRVDPGIGKAFGKFPGSFLGRLAACVGCRGSFRSCLRAAKPRLCLRRCGHAGSVHLRGDVGPGETRHGRCRSVREDVRSLQPHDGVAGCGDSCGATPSPAVVQLRDVWQSRNEVGRVSGRVFGRATVGSSTGVGCGLALAGVSGSAGAFPLRQRPVQRRQRTGQRRSPHRPRPVHAVGRPQAHRKRRSRREDEPFVAGRAAHLWLAARQLLGGHGSLVTGRRRQRFRVVFATVAVRVGRLLVLVLVLVGCALATGGGICGLCQAQRRYGRVAVCECRLLVG
mmetsp:Transcript_2617/g.10409  ORF Transcript_2617/g.10409 Transcript_2617/m.10409 type:complete len:501 (+) Transcript_2617:474-1976(+)